MAGVSVGQSQLVPDGTTLVAVNGALSVNDNAIGTDQLAHGTANMYLGFNALGAPAEMPGGGEGWVLLETSSPAGTATTVTSGTLAAYDEYMVYCALRCATAAGDLVAQFGDGAVDTGNNYVVRYINNTTNTTTAPVASIMLGTIGTTYRSNIILRVRGKTDATDTAMGCVVIGTCDTAGGKTGQGGAWVSGTSKQIDLIRISGATNITGTIQIFGRTCL